LFAFEEVLDLELGISSNHFAIWDSPCRLQHAKDIFKEYHALREEDLETAHYCQVITDDLLDTILAAIKQPDPMPEDLLK